jgi:predicted RNA binding protein YcfA (HicA-like mRNA interferase family)
MNIGSYRQYSKKNFGTETWGEMIEDKRKRPQIPAEVIVRSLSEASVFGKKTLLGMDGFLRSPESVRYYGSHRQMVASDTTLERVTAGISRRSIQAIGYDVIDKADQENLFDLVLPSGKKLRFGVVDGHWAGRVWASVLAVYGQSLGIVDLERYSGRGHELEASRKVWKRAFERLGKGFLGVVAGDGLYATKEDFQLARNHGSHLLVKTDEETLTVVQDAKHLFHAQDVEMLQGVTKQRGHDPKRFCDYEVILAEGFLWQGLILSVAWVEEWKLNKKTQLMEHSEFYILTTATGFTGEDLREMAHLRWEIENNVFKRLNHLVGSKRVWSRKSRVMELFLRMWMIGLTILGGYLFQEGWRTFQEPWRKAKKTWGLVTELMKRSLVMLYS